VERAGWRIEVAQTGHLKQTVAHSNKVAVNTAWQDTRDISVEVVVVDSIIH